MSDQLTFADAITARDKAIEQVERNAHDAWLEAAYDAVAYLVTQQDTLTSDDVWSILADSSVSTHEPRALGPVMKAGVKDGLMEPCGWVQSSRAVCHARPVRQYRSLMRGDA